MFFHWGNFWIFCNDIGKIYEWDELYRFISLSFWFISEFLFIKEERVKK